MSILGSSGVGGMVIEEDHLKSIVLGPLLNPNRNPNRRLNGAFDFENHGLYGRIHLDILAQM